MHDGARANTLLFALRRELLSILSSPQGAVREFHASDIEPIRGGSGAAGLRSAPLPVAQPVGGA